MSRFNINDFILDNTQYEFPDGNFKPLDKNKGLFIQKDKIINVLWFITHQGLLHLIINNNSKYFYLIDKKDNKFYVYEIHKNNDTGKFKKGNKFVINNIKYTDYNENKDYFYFKEKIKNILFFILTSSFFHISFFLLIIFIFNLDVKNIFIQLFFVVSYLPMFSFYKLIIKKTNNIFNT